MSAKEREYKKYVNDMNRIAYWLVENKKKFKTRDKYSHDEKTITYAEVIERIKKNKKMGYDGFVAEFVESAIADNKNFDYLPAYVVGIDGLILYKAVFVDMAKRCRLFEITNRRSPRFVYYDDSKNKSNTLVKNVKNTGKVCKAISKATGAGDVSDYKSLYNAFMKCVYAYYYNDVYTQTQALSRIAKNQDLNCTDLNQLAYYALKEMKYDVQIVRGTVRCSKLYGHVWCKIKIKDKWINFDASAAAYKKKPLGEMICGKVSEVTDVNPAWAISDDGKT